MEIDLIIIIIKVIKSTPETYKLREVANLGHLELIEITKKVIIRLMKEIIIIRKVLTTEVTNIAPELVDNRVILGKKIIITKIDKITDLEISIKKIDGMMKKEILNLKTGIMK